MHYNIPAELRDTAAWLVAEEDKAPKTLAYDAEIDSEYPVNADNRDTSSYLTFTRARAAGTRHIGFCLRAEQGIVIIDIDRKLNDDGSEKCSPAEIEAQNAILGDAADLGAYIEHSASGRGFHIIGRGSLPNNEGRRRGSIEIYSNARFMITTGAQLVACKTPLPDIQELIDRLFELFSMTAGSRSHASLDELDAEQTESDAEVWERMMRSSTADDIAKFYPVSGNTLTDALAAFGGDHSQADQALINYLCFFTPNNDQVRRLFSGSLLMRAKTFSRRGSGTYLDLSILKFRRERVEDPKVLAYIQSANGQPFYHKGKYLGTWVVTGDTPFLDASIPDPRAKVTEVQPAAPQPVTPEVVAPSITRLPGLVGELAETIYRSMPRPSYPMAEVAAIVLMAAIVGRGYNVSETGLNIYCYLLAKTGSGKDGMGSGIDAILSACAKINPAIASMVQGPALIASGQGLLKLLPEKPCFYSLQGEADEFIERITNPKANTADKMTHRVLLDIYAKSGAHRYLQGSAYSDKDKSTEAVRAPCLSILAESTPEGLFEKLDSQMIASGLLPRFIIIEHDEGRPPKNPYTRGHVTQALAQKVSDVFIAAKSSEAQNTAHDVAFDSDAARLVEQYSRRCDDMINSSTDVLRHIYNRAELNVLKLSALLAIGINYTQPVITADLVTWAIQYVERACALLSKKFQTGEVGKGDVSLDSIVKTWVDQYAAHEENTRVNYKVPRSMAHQGLFIPRSYFAERAKKNATFYKDPRGYIRALNDVLTSMEQNDALNRMSQINAKNEFHVFQAVYFKGSAF